MTSSACPQAPGLRGLQVVLRLTVGNLMKLKMDGFSYPMEPQILEALLSTTVFQVCTYWFRVSLGILFNKNYNCGVSTFI